MDSAERRRAVREQCSLNGFIYSLRHTRRSGLVFDRSDVGLGIETMEHYEPGTWVSLEFPDLGTELTSVKVARVDYEPGVGWIVGCVFVDN
jgi:hypothetical protein